jgi:hypothetical protein
VLLAASFGNAVDKLPCALPQSGTRHLRGDQLLAGGGPKNSNASGDKASFLCKPRQSAKVTRFVFMNTASGEKMENDLRQADLREAALEYHREPTPGKISVQPTKGLNNQLDLALAYSPGVAFACDAIVEDPATPACTPRAPTWSA